MFRFFRAEMYRLSKDKSFRNLIIFLLACVFFGIFGLRLMIGRDMVIKNFSTIIVILMGTFASSPFIILGISLTTYFNRDNENTALAIGTGVSRYQISFVSLFTTFILSVFCMVFVYGLFIVLSLIFLPVKFEFLDLIILFKAIIYGTPVFSAYIVWIYVLASFFKNKNVFSLAFSIYQLTVPNLFTALMYSFEWARKIIPNLLTYQLRKLINFYEIIEKSIYHPLRIFTIGSIWLIIGIIIVLFMNYKREYDIKN